MKTVIKIFEITEDGLAEIANESGDELSFASEDLAIEYIADLEEGQYTILKVTVNG